MWNVQFVRFTVLLTASGSAEADNPEICKLGIKGCICSFLSITLVKYYLDIPFNLACALNNLNVP